MHFEYALDLERPDGYASPAEVLGMVGEEETAVAVVWAGLAQTPDDPALLELREQLDRHNEPVGRRAVQRHGTNEPSPVARP